MRLTRSWLVDWLGWKGEFIYQSLGGVIETNAILFSTVAADMSLTVLKYTLSFSAAEYLSFFVFFVTCSILSKVEDLTTGLSHFSLKINTSSPIEEVFSSFTFSTIMVLIVLNGSIQSLCVSLQEEKFPKSPQDIDLESAGQKLLASLPNLNKVWDLIKRREVFCRLETIIWSCTVIYNFILDNKNFTFFLTDFLIETSFSVEK